LHKVSNQGYWNSVRETYPIPKLIIKLMGHSDGKTMKVPASQKVNYPQQGWKQSTGCALMHVYLNLPIKSMWPEDQNSTNLHPLYWKDHIFSTRKKNSLNSIRGGFCIQRPYGNASFCRFCLPEKSADWVLIIWFWSYTHWCCKHVYAA
jgi:hypothetical protein